MMHLYEAQYLETAQDALGEAIDFAVNALDLDADYFLRLFIRSGYAEDFERGDPRVLFGMSGTELVEHVLLECDLGLSETDSQESDSYGAWYWVGWVLAYYQWETALPFERIREFLSLNDIILLYEPLHEAPEQKFLETAERLRKEQFMRGERLKSLRKGAGLSQRQLAERSGVGIRAIQQYEQGAKHIEMASGLSLYRLSRVLHCRMEDLLDFPIA